MLKMFHFLWLQSCSWHPTGPPKAPHWLYDLLPLPTCPPSPGSWQLGSLFFQTLAFHSGGLLQGVQVFTWKIPEIKSYPGDRMNVSPGNQIMANIHHYQFIIIRLLDIFCCILATLALERMLGEATALLTFLHFHLALDWHLLNGLPEHSGECQWRWDLSHSCCQPWSKMSPHCWWI